MFNKTLIKKILLGGSIGSSAIILLLSKYVLNKTVTYSGRPGFKLTNYQEEQVKSEVAGFVKIAGDNWKGHYIPGFKEVDKWKFLTESLGLKKSEKITFNTPDGSTEFFIGKQWEPWIAWRDLCYSKQNWALNHGNQRKLVTGAVLNFCTIKK